MRLAEIDPSLNPEPIPPRVTLRSFHRALRYRYYYLTWPILASLLLPLVNRAARYFGQHGSRKNVADTVVGLLFISSYVSLIEATCLFSFGTYNRYDPLLIMSDSNARLALNILRRSARRIYEDNFYKMLIESPEYGRPNHKIVTITEIDRESAYTPLTLAKEVGAKKISRLFEKIAEEERIIFLLLRALTQQDGRLASLDRDSTLHIVSFLAGGSIIDHKDKTPANDREQLADFSRNYAAKQRDELPRLLIYFEQKQSHSKAATITQAKTEVVSLNREVAVRFNQI